jgi:hypothetical protein
MKECSKRDYKCLHNVKKPLSQRWHECECGVGPVQRDLYSAFLTASLEPGETVPSITQSDWAGAEARLRAVMERLEQRANAGHSLPQSMGIPRARVRRLQSLCDAPQELLFRARRGRVEAWKRQTEPPVL